ncbi:CARDB domain-containing protein [Halobaculum sp. EA56]|uniref:CARDB domain-containing protein n=1 Tax=Halobaculum sp. EA56 TaxID=3421648 RepID=UPI003EB8A2D5
MGARRSVLIGAVVLFVAALLLGPAVGAAGAQSASCEANGARKVCLSDVTLGSETMSAGESTELSLTVENVGEERATAVVVLNVASPDNETNSYELRKRSLEPGETLTVTQSVDASTPGTHAMQVLVYDGDLAHRYDASEPMSVTVKRQGLGGPVDTPEFALAALVGSLAVVGVLAYRRT